MTESFVYVLTSSSSSSQMRTSLTMKCSFFREMNPNYARLKMDGSSSAIGCIDFFNGSSISTENTEKVRYADLKTNELELADLLFYCLIVSDFSFTDKL